MKSNFFIVNKVLSSPKAVRKIVTGTAICILCPSVIRKLIAGMPILKLYFKINNQIMFKHELRSS